MKNTKKQLAQIIQEVYKNLQETKKTEKLLKENFEPEKYYYYINLDERGEFYADVRDENDSTIYEIKGFDIFEDGTMRDKEDLGRLKNHLVSLDLMDESDELVNGSLYEGDGVGLMNRHGMNAKPQTLNESEFKQLVKKLIKEELGPDKENNSGEVEIMSTDEYLPITIPENNKEDYELFAQVINKGIDSHLEGFTKSKFGHKNTSLGKRYVFNFHLSELPILLRRLEELKDEGSDAAYGWYDDILDLDIYKCGITYETVTPESLEAGDAEDRGWEEEYEEASINDIESKANNHGIYEPSSTPVSTHMWWSSVDAESSREHFERGEDKYYSLHITRMNGADISLEEVKFFDRLINPRAER